MLDFFEEGRGGGGGGVLVNLNFSKKNILF